VILWNIERSIVDKKKTGSEGREEAERNQS
jgi:hypothetical protein